MIRVFAWLAPLIVGACSSFQGLPDRVTSTGIPVEHIGDVSGESWLDREAGAETSIDATNDAIEDVDSYEHVLFEVDRTAAYRVLGLAGAPNASLVDLVHAHVRLRELAKLGYASEVHRTAIATTPGRPAMASLVNQTAYLKRFSVQSTPHSMLADPEIAVAKDGVRLVITPAKDAIDVNAEITLARLQRPIPTVSIQPLNQGAFTKMQTPIFANDRIRLRTALEPGTAAMIGGIPSGDADTMIVALLARRAPHTARAFDALSADSYAATAGRR